jgi:hypothetical protein
MGGDRDMPGRTHVGGHQQGRQDEAGVSLQLSREGDKKDKQEDLFNAAVGSEENMFSSWARVPGMHLDFGDVSVKRGLRGGQAWVAEEGHAGNL